MTDSEIKSYRARSKKVQSWNTATGIRKAFLASPELAADEAQCDADPLVLHVPSGAVNLRTGTLRKRTREDRATFHTPIDPHPIGGELWQRTINEIIPDQGLRDYLQRALGYSLIGEVRDNVFFQFDGGGRNGKGIILSTVAAALGPYASAMRPEVVTLGRSENKYYDLDGIRGRRFLSVEEIPKQKTLDSSLLKSLSAGDTIRARGMRQGFSDFTPRATLFLSSNGLPRVNDDSPGFWARCKTIPFSVSFLGREDVNLKSKLLAELPSVLHWLIEGARLYLQDGLVETKAVTKAVAQYRADSDSVLAFINEFVSEETVTQEESVSRAEFYSRYKRFADDAGMPALTKYRLHRLLEARGWEHKKQTIGGSRQHIWLGVKLLPDDDSSGRTTPGTGSTGLLDDDENETEDIFLNLTNRKDNKNDQ